MIPPNASHHSMAENPPSLLHQAFPKMMAAGVKDQPRGEELRARQEQHRLALAFEQSTHLPEACLQRWDESLRNCLPFRLHPMMDRGKHGLKIPDRPLQPFLPASAITAGSRRNLSHLLGSGGFFPLFGPPPYPRQSFPHPRRFGP